MAKCNLDCSLVVYIRNFWGTGLHSVTNLGSNYNPIYQLTHMFITSLKLHQGKCSDFALQHSPSITLDPKQGPSTNPKQWCKDPHEGMERLYEHIPPILHFICSLSTSV